MKAETRNTAAGAVEEGEFVVFSHRHKKLQLNAPALALRAGLAVPDSQIPERLEQQRKSQPFACNFDSSYLTALRHGRSRVGAGNGIAFYRVTTEACIKNSCRQDNSAEYLRCAPYLLHRRHLALMSWH
jgi:hypothetical protein